MKCPKCGANLTKEDAFCPECGAKLKTKQSKPNTIYIIIGSIAVILIIAVVLSVNLIPRGEKCKVPYIEFKSGECCLDTNRNNVCDNDEKVSVEEVAPEPIKQKQTEPKIQKIPKDEYDPQRSIQLTGISPSDGQSFNPGEVEITLFYDSIFEGVSQVDITWWYYVDGAYDYTISTKRIKNCPIGYNQKCSFTLDLSNYLGKRIGLFGSIYTEFSDEKRNMVYSGWKGLDRLSKEESIFINIQ